MCLSHEEAVVGWGMQCLNLGQKNLLIFLSNPGFLTLLIRLPSRIHLEWLIPLIELVEVEHPIEINCVFILMPCAIMNVEKMISVVCHFQYDPRLKVCF